MASRDEVTKILAVIKQVYPNYNPDDVNATIDTWHMILNEVPYESLNAALATYIKAGHEFAPNPGMLYKECQQIKRTVDGSLNEMEAWALVSKAVRDGNYHSIERYNALPEMVKEAVGSADNIRNWAMTDLESLETVIQSQFVRSYRAVVARHEHIEAMPGYIKEQIPTKSYDAPIGIEARWEPPADRVDAPDDFYERIGVKVYGV